MEKASTKFILSEAEWTQPDITVLNYTQQVTWYLK